MTFFNFYSNWVFTPFFLKICKNVKSRAWTVVQDSEKAMGPYAYRDRQWLSYDDVSMVRKKAELVKSMKLGGAMIWSLDLDDFKGNCECEAYPLLKTVNRVLRNYPSASCKASKGVNQSNFL